MPLWQRLWSSGSGERHCWVLDVRPRDVPFKSASVFYVKDQHRRRQWNTSPPGRAKIRIRQRSLARARKLGLYDAAIGYYTRKGWPKHDRYELHHFDGADAGEGEPERWAILPKAAHQLIHDRRVAKSHPWHPQYGKPGGVSLNRRRAALSYL